MRGGGGRLGFCKRGEIRVAAALPGSLPLIHIPRPACLLACLCRAQASASDSGQRSDRDKGEGGKVGVDGEGERTSYSHSYFH